MATGSVNRTYLGLDLIRLGAALLVVLYHLTFWWWLPFNAVKTGAIYRTTLQGPAHIFSGGWAGVQIFFVLSGFVIAFSANSKTAREFLIGRITRLYPAAWICATITLSVTFNSASILDYLRAMALSPVGPWISGVFWTLGVEAAFYALVAVVLAIWGAKHLFTFGFILGCYSSIFWWLHVADPLIGFPFRPLFSAIENQYGYLLLLHHGCDFALGMTLWKWGSDGANRKIVLACVLFLISGLMGVAGMSRGIAPILATPTYIPNWHVAPLIWLAAVGLISSSIRWNDQLWSWLGRWSGNIRFVGLMTYPIYLVHSELGEVVMLEWRGSPMLTLVLALSVILAISALVAVLEKYPRRMILHILAPSKRSWRPLPASDLP